MTAVTTRVFRFGRYGASHSGDIGTLGARGHATIEA